MAFEQGWEYILQVIFNAKICSTQIRNPIHCRTPTDCYISIFHINILSAKEMT